MLDKKSHFDKMKGHGLGDVLTADKAIFFTESEHNMFSPKGRESTWIFNQVNSSGLFFCSWLPLAGLGGGGGTIACVFGIFR